ncbi:PilW family protein [Acinetobacter sp. CFCC 10889]|uniref:PilW family protein n=1 Tax=Acinetobacter sp. CFCC 10889 TaxID=1775557 RepID=UPI000DCF6674|nr:PilW family protein [Acinetobacter sp. CFCC 10889]
MIKIKQKGFTLIELMVSIGLGLLIVAAGLAIFLSSLKNSRLQEGVSQIQDGGIFGLEYIANQVRLANYGNVENRTLNDQTSRGGVVFTTGLPTQSNINLAMGNANATTAFENTIVTRSTSGLSNVSLASDQLTIQFVAPNDMQNCVGENVRKGDRVVQRYFLRQENNKADHDTNITSMGLACVANTPLNTPNATPTFLTGFGVDNTGEIIIPNVDYFGFLLGARTGNNYRYYTVAEYTAVATAARNATPAQEVPSIEMIKMAVLIRSQNEVRTAPITLSTYEILGRTVTLNTPATTGVTNKFVRNVYVTTIALRNALGDKL